MATLIVKKYGRNMAESQLVDKYNKLLSAPPQIKGNGSISRQQLRN